MEKAEDYTKANLLQKRSTDVMNVAYWLFFWGFIPQRSESSKSITMLPLPCECWESKVRYSAPWGGKGGNAS